MNKLVLTNAGRTVLNNIIAESGTLQFSTAKSTSDVINVADIPDMTELTNIKQSVSISSVENISNTNTQLCVVFNGNIDASYKLCAVGIYVVHNNSTILFAVGIESNNVYVNPNNSDTIINAVKYTFNIAFSDNSIVNVVNPIAVTQEQLKERLRNTGEYTIGKNYAVNDLFTNDNGTYIVNSNFTASTTIDFSKVTFLGVKSKYDHFEMEIDANVNSNPSVENGGIKYSGGCEGFSQQDWVEWLGYKPCIIYGQGNIECYLDPNNYANDINGNSVDISNAVTSDGYTRNVMVRYPRIGLQSQQITVGKWIIRCTNNPCDNRYLYSAFSSGKRKFQAMYIGAYNSSVSDGKLHSISNADIISTGHTLESYRTLAQANGVFYNILDIKKLTFLKHLYMLQNSTINGKLMNWFDLDNLQTGFYNTIGLNKNDISTRLGKFLGLETNGFTEIIEGAYVDENYRLKISDNDLYNSDGSGYIDSGKIYTLGTGYMGKNVSFDVDCGIIANNAGGTDTALFNCQTYLVNPSTFMNANMRNIFNYEFKFNATSSFNGTNARLCYLAV